VSTTNVVFAEWINTLLRSLLSFLSEDVQTAQLQPIIGTPVLVPVPRNVIVRGGHVTSEFNKERRKEG
jgi:hypothetical protein